MTVPVIATVRFIIPQGQKRSPDQERISRSKIYEGQSFKEVLLNLILFKEEGIIFLIICGDQTRLMKINSNEAN